MLEGNSTRRSSIPGNFRGRWYSFSRKRKLPGFQNILGLVDICVRCSNMQRLLLADCFAVQLGTFEFQLGLLFSYFRILSSNV